MTGTATAIARHATATAVEEPPRRPDSETYVRDEALEGPADDEALAERTLPPCLAGSVETRGARLKRLAAAAVVWLEGKGLDVTRASLAMASEVVDDDPARLPRREAGGGAPPGMPPAPAAADGGDGPSRKRLLRGFVESAIDSNGAVRGIYEANARPSNLAIGKRRGRRGKRQRKVAVVPAHVMARKKRDIARDYMRFRRLAETRRVALLHANAVILEMGKMQHRKAAKGEAAAARRAARPSNDQ